MKRKSSARSSTDTYLDPDQATGVLAQKPWPLTPEIEKNISHSWLAFRTSCWWALGRHIARQVGLVSGTRYRGDRTHPDRLCVDIAAKTQRHLLLYWFGEMKILTRNSLDQRRAENTAFYLSKTRSDRFWAVPAQRQTLLTKAAHSGQPPPEIKVHGRQCLKLSDRPILASQGLRLKLGV